MGIVMAIITGDFRFPTQQVRAMTRGGAVFESIFKDIRSMDILPIIGMRKILMTGKASGPICWRIRCATANIGNRRSGIPHRSGGVSNLMTIETIAIIALVLYDPITMERRVIPTAVVWEDRYVSPFRRRGMWF
jgi:hypothetical protein